MLLPRSTPAAEGVSSRAIAALLDRLEELSVECHSIMVARHGRVVAEGWWAPFTAGRPHLLYSLTKSYTSIAVGLAVADGLLSLDDRLVDVLPGHVPADMPEQGRRLTVHHLLSMTAGHDGDSLDEAWRLEPGDLIKGFLRVPFPDREGTKHAYDNATTFALARIVERVTGRDLREFLAERLLTPMGVDHAEWDTVASGRAFGFHGLHLTTEAVTAFGQMLLRGGRWGDRQLVPRDWVELATRQHIALPPAGEHSARGYGYQFWIARHGYYGDGAFGQHCVVVPSKDLVVAVTSANVAEQTMPESLWECLLPGLDHPDSATDDEALAERLRGLTLTPVPGTADPQRSFTARFADDAEVLPGGTTLVVEPGEDGWRLRFGSLFAVPAGHGTWRESAPLGRPVVTTAAWQGDTFVADLYVITTPHRVRVVADAGEGTATAAWHTVPLTGSDLLKHLQAPLMTRPDVA